MKKARRKETNLEPRNIRCLAIGDGAVGKTSLLQIFAMNSFPSRYVPTVFENYVKTVTYKKMKFNLELYDSAGQEEWDQLRVMMYSCTDLFIVCFAVHDFSSFANVESKWIPEIRKYKPMARTILVGTQIDQRDNLRCCINTEDGNSMSQKLNMSGYYECSSFKQIGGCAELPQLSQQSRIDQTRMTRDSTVTEQAEQSKNTDETNQDNENEQLVSGKTISINNHNEANTQ
ncbi:hypothetical protein GJ496_005813 [Pomphorhynchus laevis]|nr:hypothetical protein GJ496_005813 [Pomphorhynchus laevis]